MASLVNKRVLLGVTGGGAIISGVLWVLSGLTLRNDSRAASGKP